MRDTPKFKLINSDTRIISFPFDIIILSWKITVNIIYIYIYTHTHTHIYIYIYTYICTYTHRHTHMHTYTPENKCEKIYMNELYILSVMSNAAHIGSRVRHY